MGGFIALRTDVDTSKVAVNRRLSFWSEAVCANLVGVECKSPNNMSMMGRFTQLSNEGFAFARLRAEPHLAVRGRSTIRKSDTNFFMLFLQKSGTMRVTRRNRVFIVRPGDMYFYDGATEHQLSFHEHFDHLAVRIRVLDKRGKLRRQQQGVGCSPGSAACRNHVQTDRLGVLVALESQGSEGTKPEFRALSAKFTRVSSVRR